MGWGGDAARSASAGAQHPSPDSCQASAGSARSRAELGLSSRLGLVMAMRLFLLLELPGACLQPHEHSRLGESGWKGV